MSSIPDVSRYAVRKDALIAENDEFPPAFPHDYLEFVVLHADHITALDAAENAGREFILNIWEADGYPVESQMARAYRIGRAVGMQTAGSVNLDDIALLNEIRNEQFAKGYEKGQRDERVACAHVVDVNAYAHDTQDLPLYASVLRSVASQIRARDESDD